MDMVALGEPGTPLIFWASTGNHQKPEVTTITRARSPVIIGWKRFGRRRSSRDFRFLNMVVASQFFRNNQEVTITLAMAENRQVMRIENI
jgi:hypothetical protein